MYGVRYTCASWRERLLTRRHKEAGLKEAALLYNRESTKGFPLRENELRRMSCSILRSLLPTNDQRPTVNDLPCTIYVRYVA
jgi:hypothetical protein